MGILSWIIICLVIAAVAAVFGFTGIASAFAGIAKILFYILLFIILALVVMIIL
ncbi:MAG: hypothetical protein BWY69_00405 [Planctomycetes bacterium ADurb.Bin401]|nr:MAG: hypothetical protein BWY69_00405 [Planctomycetes bacterium ADurb.Bin401]